MNLYFESPRELLHFFLRFECFGFSLSDLLLCFVARFLYLLFGVLDLAITPD